MIEIETEARPAIALSPETAFFILLKARQFDGKVEQTDPDSGSDPADDREVDILEDSPDDATLDELTAAIDGLSDEQQLDLVALIWIGRGDFGPAEWDEARAAAADIGRARVPRYVAGIPLVSDYLEEALARFGWRLADYLDEH